MFSVVKFGAKEKETTMGILDKMKEIAAEGQKTLAAQKAREDAKAKELARIIVSTGGIPRPHEVIDAVFAMDSHKEGFFSGASPAKAFEGVKDQLRAAGLVLGGDAIINCQFEYRVAMSGNNQCIEIFAYGTAVKWVKDSRSESPKDTGLNTSSAGARERTPQQPPPPVASAEIAFACPKCSQSLKVVERNRFAEGRTRCEAVFVFLKG
jgi:hypothetical protein